MAELDQSLLVIISEVRVKSATIRDVFLNFFIVGHLSNLVDYRFIDPSEIDGVIVRNIRINLRCYLSAIHSVYLFSILSVRNLFVRKPQRIRLFIYIYTCINL